MIGQVLGPGNEYNDMRDGNRVSEYMFNCLHDL